jgi:hypothetical protein
MPLDFTKAECMQEISEEESNRLAQKSTNCCPSCWGPMTVGDEEYIGLCATCYGVAMDEYNKDQGNA